MLLPWTTQVNTEFHSHSPFNVFKSFILQHSTDCNTPLYGEAIDGYTEEDINEYLRTYPEIRLLFRDKDSTPDISYIYALKNFDTLIQLRLDDNHIDMEIFSLDEKILIDIVSGIKKKLSEAPVKGTVHMLALEQNYYLTPLGEIDHPLERENYTNKVLVEYDRALEDLKSDTPSGRLIILDGEAGTGKSFLVRGIISAMTGLFIYIPSSVAGQITGPDMIPLIMREKEKNIPIILLMEDADSSLATRQMDNVGKLSDLLNMSDGILGETADIRIIATTNSKQSEIDKAVIRPGRLSEYIHLDFLTEEHALDIFMRLTETNSMSIPAALVSKKITLADVYKIARSYGWKPPLSSKGKKNKKRISLPDYYDC